MTGFSRRALLGAALGSTAALAMSRSPTSALARVSWWVEPGELIPGDAWSAQITGSPFSRPIGSWQAGDLPHAYPLPDGRVLWLLNDSFMSSSPDGSIDGRSWFVRNVAIEQNGTAMSVVDNGRSSYASENESLYDRWWWFHGGEVDGALLHVVTTEMIRTGTSGWAINFEPRSTWITTIAWRSSTILSMRPAPNPGVTPVYGFSVASDDAFTYLFGNNHLYGSGTTENRVARVARGKLLEAPEYWDGERWTTDPGRAVSVQTHGAYACRMAVVRLGTRWFATSKDEEFFGSEAVVWIADQPAGPWREHRRLAIPTATGDDRTCTYDVMSRPLDDRRLIVWWSNNAYDEALTRRDPSVYRPTFTVIEV